MNKKLKSVVLSIALLVSGTGAAQAEDDWEYEIAPLYLWMVGIEGETMRGVTWVRVHEVNSGEWGIGGKALTADDVKALQAGAA